MSKFIGEDFMLENETAILRDHLRHEVAMVIDDWHFCCMFVIQFLSCLRLEQEIGIEKGSHDL